VVSAAAGVVVHIGAVDTSLFAAAAALGAVRLYAAACYRLEKMFLTLVGQSIAYVLGAILGMGALRYFPYYSLPFVAGEFAACVHFVIKLDRFPLSLTRTSALKATCAVFAQLGVLSLLTNLVMYADRLLLYPLLGHTAVAVYYAASAMSKISGLLTNPIASFLLSRLSLSDDASRPTIVLAAIKWTTVLVPVSLLGNLAVSYFSLVTLYPKYYDASVTLLLPVCGSAALTDCVVMLRTVLLRFHGSRSVLWIYAIYLAFFAVAGVCLSHFFGLWGFVAANLLARVFLWLSCVLVLYTHRLTHEQRPPGPNSP
jgi:O-antigen/teichoic acid export membrane protein